MAQGKSFRELAPKASAYITKLSTEVNKLERENRRLKKCFKDDHHLKSFMVIVSDADRAELELKQAQDKLATEERYTKKLKDQIKVLEKSNRDYVRRNIELTEESNMLHHQINKLHQRGE